MKQLKFLKTISCDGRPIWYKDCCYEIIAEGTNSQMTTMYKLMCEDFQIRGIDARLSHDFFEVIEIKPEEIQPKIEKEITSETKTEEKTEPKKTTKKRNKKK